MVVRPLCRGTCVQVFSALAQGVGSYSELYVSAGGWSWRIRGLLERSGVRASLSVFEGLEIERVGVLVIFFSCECVRLGGACFSVGGVLSVGSVVEFQCSSMGVERDVRHPCICGDFVVV